VTLLVTINCQPNSITEKQAYLFCLNALKSKISCTIFFYDKGVAIGLGQNIEVTQRWSELLTHHKLDASLCVNAVNTQREETQVSTSPASGFAIAGMAQLAAACASPSHKSISFACRELRSMPKLEGQVL